VWAASGTGEEASQTAIAETGVSFALPLAFVPTVHYITAGETTLPEGCTGSATEPGAEEGFLCVFGEQEFNLLAKPGVQLHEAAKTGRTYGFAVSAFNNAKGAMIITGTWAVAAKE
jgi:hypothetical protein